MDPISIGFLVLDVGLNAFMTASRRLENQHARQIQQLKKHNSSISYNTDKKKFIIDPCISIKSGCLIINYIKILDGQGKLIFSLERRLTKSKIKLSRLQLKSQGYKYNDRWYLYDKKNLNVAIIFIKSPIVHIFFNKKFNLPTYISSTRTRIKDNQKFQVFCEYGKPFCSLEHGYFKWTEDLYLEKVNEKETNILCLGKLIKKDQVQHSHQSQNSNSYEFYYDDNEIDLKVIIATSLVSFFNQWEMNCKVKSVNVYPGRKNRHSYDNRSKRVKIIYAVKIILRDGILFIKKNFWFNRNRNSKPTISAININRN